jgi:hypothetical protein
MSRIAYIAEVDPTEVAAIAYVAGLLQGQGVQQGAVIGGILERLQMVEVPDDFGAGEDVGEVGSGDGSAEDTGGEQETDNVVQFPQPVNEDGVELDSTLPAIDPLADPTSPESLGIQLNLPAPPPPPGPQSAQDTFGAGPPPKE